MYYRFGEIMERLNSFVQKAISENYLKVMLITTMPIMHVTLKYTMHWKYKNKTCYLHLISLFNSQIKRHRFIYSKNDYNVLVSIS